MALPAYRPEFELQARELARHVDRNTTRHAQLLPQLATRLELEVLESSVIGNLPRR
jgi:hypothetical protein